MGQKLRAGLQAFPSDHTAQVVRVEQAFRPAEKLQKQAALAAEVQDQGRMQDGQSCRDNLPAFAPGPA